MNNKEYLKLKVRANQLQAKHRPLKKYSYDTIAANLHKCFKQKYPDGSTSEAATKYAFKKLKTLAIYKA